MLPTSEPKGPMGELVQQQPSTRTPHDDAGDPTRRTQAKKPLVVFKKKPISLKISKRPTSLQLQQKARQRQSGKYCSTDQQMNKPRRGLPTFSIRTAAEATTPVPIHPEGRNTGDDDNDALELDGDDDALFENLACDTYLVFQSLLLNPHTRIDIPIPAAATTSSVSGNNKDSIPGILECQLHERFQTGASFVSRELEELLRNNTLRCFVSTVPVVSWNLDARGGATLTVLIRTEDYVRAVRAYNNNNNTITSSDTPSNHQDQQTRIIDWFLHHLKDWTRKQSGIAMRDIERAWETTSLSLPSSWNIQRAIRLLQDSQFLMTASSDHESFRLWLPSWGSLVLPAFIKAQTTSIAYLRQSQYKERSLPSLIRRLSTHPIPVEHVLISWLAAQGYVERIERPAGPCIRLITD
jgi:hypothetical protein